QKLATDDDGNAVDLGFVGEVTEVKVKLIKKEIADGFVPVISPVAEGYDGKPYNVNADLVAGRVASALRARKLFYMSDVAGLLASPPDPASLISTLRTSQVDELKKKGVIDKGMLPKVASAVRALEEGVQRVHFIDGRLPHSPCSRSSRTRGSGPRSSMAEPPSIVRTSAAEMYDAHVLKNYARQPLTLVRGSGTTVWDDRGRAYLDFSSGIAVSALGHCHPDWVAAVRRQAGELIHVSNLFRNPNQGELARRLVGYAGPGRVFFCN